MDDEVFQSEVRERLRRIEARVDRTWDVLTGAMILAVLAVVVLVAVRVLGS